MLKTQLKGDRHIDYITGQYYLWGTAIKHQWIWYQ